MSVVLRKLLDEAAQLRGVWAAGLVHGDRTVDTSMGHAPHDLTNISSVWRYLADTAEVSTHHRMPPQEMRWIFENVLVYCLRRSDGKMLALIIGRSTGDGFDSAAAERLFEEFKNTRDA
ncbi:hypothetical protein GC207_08215 [bacterium]|nr:hypothetical protein [bacterium]